MADRGLDALVVSTPANVRYLTNFAGSSGQVVVSAGQCVLITDGRYEFSVREALAAGELAEVTLERVEQRYDLATTALLVRSGHRRVGFEAEHTTVATLGAWQRGATAIDWVPTERLVERQRMVKDASEIAIYRRGAAMMVRVAASLPAILHEGRTERDVARAIESALEAEGFTGPSFPTIVASGPNSALPHARPGSRRLTRGDLVVLDFGGVLDGYCLDLTRAAAVGVVSAGARALFDAVSAAHEAALRAVKPGVETSAVDGAARQALEARGLGAAFLHSTGHGLGLEIHEAPRLARAETGASEPIAAGMIFTIEPGVYVEGLGGVRLEDDVLVTADGCEILTGASRDLLVV
jgi:Xaa-Pro aminopeptidase